MGNMQYGANQGYGPGPGGQQNPQPNNMGPGQYQGRPMPNHVPQFPYQVSGYSIDVTCPCLSSPCSRLSSCIPQYILCHGIY